MKRSRIIFTCIALLFAAGIAAGFFFRSDIRDWQLNVQKADLPQETNIADLPPYTTNSALVTNTNALEPDLEPVEPEPTKPDPIITIPTELNLDIPFTSQAPFGVWDHAHGEYCEEASLLMANRFLSGRDIEGPEDADAGLVAIANWQTERFGYFESTTAEETAITARDFLGLQAKVVEDFTWDDAKREMIQGHMVLLPAAGQNLGNPYFTPPGPVYHMLLVKGWTPTQIITNDPGTKRGENYVYDPEVLYEAVGDYNHNDPANGKTVMVVVWK